MNKFSLASALLAWIGLIDSAYLTWVKLAHQEAKCNFGLGDCYTVNTSRYSEIYGIPIALLGVLAYLAILLLLVFEHRHPFLEEYAPLAVFGISLAGTLYSAYLSYIEAAVLHAWCPYCVLSAIAITAIFLLSLPRLFSISDHGG
ncbi:MAG: vitamin K epoxide reductase family protein [Anaerolineales bacterium]